jgi:dUTP pyrophosphatase
MRVAQIVFASVSQLKVVEQSLAEATTRGSGGFGSTGSA